MTNKDLNNLPLETSLVDCFKIIGRNDDSFIESYVAKSKLDESEQDFFVVIEVLNQDIDGDEIADSLVETFRKHFYEESTLDDYARFEEALKYVNDVARDIQANGVPLYQLNIAIAALSKDTLYLTQSNDAEIYLVRGGHLSNISEGLSVGKRKEHSDLFENIATGVLEKGDSVIFSTARLIRYLSQAELARLFHYKDVEVALGNLEDAISTDVLGRIGVLGLKVMSPLVVIPDEELALAESRNPLDKLDKVKFFAKKSLKYSKELFASISELVVFLKKFISGKKVKIDSLKHRKPVLILSGVLLVLFFGFLLNMTGVFTSSSKKENLVLLDQAKSIIASARSEQDRKRASQLLLNAESKLTEVYTTKSLKSEADEVSDELNEVKALIDNLVVLNELPVFADISAKRSNANIIGMQRYLNNYYAFDDARLYEFIGSLVKEPVDLIDQGVIKAGVSFEDTESLVFLTDQTRIREYTSGVVKYMDTEDAVFKPGNAIAAYGSRVYILDNITGQIWKYQRRRDSYSKAEPALNNIDNAKVKTAVSFAIDGSVYLLYKNGTIERYYAGSLDPEFEFELKPLSRINSANYIYTDSDFPYVLVMESATKKIFQYYKDQQNGNLRYMRQYYFEDLDSITGFIADVANRRLLVSDKNKVYNTELLN